MNLSSLVLASPFVFQTVSLGHLHGLHFRFVVRVCIRACFAAFALVLLVSVCLLFSSIVGVAFFGGGGWATSAPMAFSCLFHQTCLLLHPRGAVVRPTLFVGFKNVFRCQYQSVAYNQCRCGCYNNGNDDDKYPYIIVTIALFT